MMLLASPNHLARSPPVSQNLTHVNNPGIIANASAADLRKLFTEPRNRLFTSSESAAAHRSVRHGAALACRDAVKSSLQVAESWHAMSLKDR